MRPRPRSTGRPATAALWAALLAACGGGDEDVARGRGLAVAPIPAAERAAVYDAALRAAFDVEPGLVLLLAPEHLPRSAALTGGPPLPAELVAALRERGVVQGTCALPPAAGEDAVPRCAAAAPGYLVRLSEPLQMAGDTLQVYLDAERFALPDARPAPPFHFESAYQLVRRGDGWAVVREGRVPDAARTRAAG